MFCVSNHDTQYVISNARPQVADAAARAAQRDRASGGDCARARLPRCDGQPRDRVCGLPTDPDRAGLLRHQLQGGAEPGAPRPVAAR